MSAQAEISTDTTTARSFSVRAAGRARTSAEAGTYRSKRAFDVAFSIAVLLFGAPVYAVLALLVAVTSPGPVLYRQERIGKDGDRFDCLKFRTMVEDAEERLASILASCPDSREEFERTFKLSDDPRITRVGRFLRRSSLDELPQFWNVIRGDMSIVGPRPFVEDELGKYGEALDEILRIRPGLTGPWQVGGRNDLSYETRVELALEYAQTNAMLSDLRIIARTSMVMFRGENCGAY